MPVSNLKVNSRNRKLLTSSTRLLPTALLFTSASKVSAGKKKKTSSANTKAVLNQGTCIPRYRETRKMKKKE